MSDIIYTEASLKEAVDYFLKRPAFVFDVEAAGDNRGVPTQNKVTWISLATQGKAIVVPLGHPNGSTLISKATRKKNKLTGKFDFFPAVYDEPPGQLSPSKVFSMLRPLFFNHNIAKGAHNASYDFISVTKYFGALPVGPYFDTITMQHLVNENLVSKKLKDLIKAKFGVIYDDENVGKCVEIHPFDVVAKYSYLDSKYDWLIFLQLLDQIKKDDLEEVYQLECDLLGPLLRMALVGAPFDHQRAIEFEKQLTDQLIEIEGNIYKLAGKKFNTNSSQQKATILYSPKSEGGQGLKPVVLTDGGISKEKQGVELKITDYSTKSDVLDEHYSTNKLVQEMIRYSKHNKLLGMVRTIIGQEEEGKPCKVFDGRIYSDLVPSGTVTGRFSCRDPNLQQIPRPDSELGKEFRGLFVAPGGHKLVVADYGQIELVVLASYCGQGSLYDGFANGIDAHTATAAAVYKVSPSEVTPQQRTAAKALNFAIVYGAGDNKVASMAKTSVREAKRLLDEHKKAFPEIYKFQEAVLSKARGRKPPHIKTIMGRKRRVPYINSRQRAVRLRGERQIFNSLIQGGAADLIKKAMIRLDAALPDDMQLVLSIHDELVTVVPEDRVNIAVSIVKEAMEGEGLTNILKVVPKADIKIVDRWSEAK